VTDLYDVAIVGYGPVGQTLAILLGQRGWRVGVFEKWPQPYPLPRAVHFDHEIGRIFQAVGVAEELRAISEPAYVYEWRNAAGDTLLRIGREGASRSGWPESNMFSQPDLERVLDARARALPSVEVHRGQEVVGLAADEPGRRADGAAVELTLAGPNGNRRGVRARWVVGCDGANSFVRPHLQPTITDLGFFFDWLIVDVVPRERRVWEPLNWQLCDPARPTTIVSGGPGRRRWEFMRLPGESIDDLNNEATAWRLLAPWDVTPANATLERHAVYTFQARWVDTWRRGRLLLAGDAAHQMPPFAGQGMCSGLRDATNLAWKLDLVLAGTAPEALLDTYASERIPQVRAVIDLSIELGKVICVPDPAEAAARDAAMTAAVREGVLAPPIPSATIGPGLLLAGDPRAGQLFMQAQVRRDGVTGLFDDVIGRAWTLVSPSCDPAALLDAESAVFFAAIGGISAHVCAGGPIEDVSGGYAGWFAGAGVAVALQRPDFYLFGTARRPEDTPTLVRELRGSLATLGG
jgi:2-polyprenyl-6-methoxyphenol hydroxylase-like FAD-dependent oxidoreductase